MISGDRRPKARLLVNSKGLDMAYFENCVERATALAATCGWLAFGGGAEAAVGVAVGGAGLAALVSDAVDVMDRSPRLR